MSRWQQPAPLRSSRLALSDCSSASNAAAAFASPHTPPASPALAASSQQGKRGGEEAAGGQRGEKENSRPGSASAARRLSLVPLSERVLRIHSVTEGDAEGEREAGRQSEAVSRLSLSVAPAAAPSFRYSLRSSYRSYQWTPQHASRQSLHEQRSPPRALPAAAAGDESTAAALSPPRPPAQLHHRPVSSRKDRTTAAGLEDEPAVSSSGVIPSSSSSSSSPLSAAALSSQFCSPLLRSAEAASSFSTLPYYRSPTVEQQSLTALRRQRAEQKEEEASGRLQRDRLSPAAVPAFASAAAAEDASLGLSAGPSDGSFAVFVGSACYAAYESEVRHNVDLIRRSNAINEDAADYVLILSRDHTEPEDGRPQQTDEQQAEQQPGQQRGGADDEVEMYMRQLQGAAASSSPGRARKRSHPLPPLPTLAFSELSRRFSSRHQLERGRANSAVIVDRLRSAGLDVRVDSLRLSGRVLLRVSASVERLEAEAERMRMRLRVKAGGWRKFDRSLREQFVGSSGDSAEMFRSSERQQIIDHVVRSKQTEGGAGLDDQFASIVVDRFPLHMYARLLALQPWLAYWQMGSSAQSLPRRLLLGLFAQPLEAIAAYYGEQVAFYFAFLGFYSLWLCIPTLLGLALFLSQLSHTSLDSPLVPFFSLLMALWSSFFIEYWRRRQSVLAVRFGVWQLDANDEETTRPEYVGQLQRHEVTGELQRVYPTSARVKKICLSALLCFLIVAAFSTLILQLFMFQTRDFGSVQGIDDSASSFFSVDALFVPVVWGLLIPVSELAFNWLAERLTAWENWRTASLHSKNKIVKIFSFRFLNSFLALYYYAFADVGLLRLTTSVASFLIIGSAFRFLLYSVCPAVYRRCSDRITRDKARQAIAALQQQQQEEGAGSSRPPHSRPLSVSSAWLESGHLQYEPFEDYCQLVVQFGYVSFFSLAFPLAPLCALLTNVLELRLGAYKLLRVYRRPLAVRSSGIGVWLSVLQVMSIIAVLSNCALLGFTSQQVDVWAPDVSAATKILIIFLFEHVVLLIKFLIHQSLLLSVPRELSLQLQRERHHSEGLQQQLMKLSTREQQQLQLNRAEKEAERHDLA